ncbi:amidohydrolase family protein [Bacillus sp. PK3_68]|uniref:amidohydrolase family protein n=1 Tax=Bacillus sp. PK3_68 TaxID=2027408 RepID=UPI000E743A9E|nr:amidohydrolase family protein [Bacillus sp. PK3_68]RJS50114.1 deaminase [Bacillus sp. PK3_68]
MSTTYWLTNVLLESSLLYKNNVVAETNTESCHIRIDQGTIKEIIIATKPLTGDLPKQDAKGLLMLPSFQDMHIHLDKTYYGGPWKAPTPFVNIFGRIEEEKEMLPHLLPVTKERAEKIMDLLLQNGTTHIRAQCNVDPTIGLENFEAISQALESYRDKLTYELVAFPQHGLLRSKSINLVREALQRGATHVGGVDPATVDEDIETSLRAMFELAIEADAGIDLHLHDKGHLGTFTMKRLAALTEKTGWQGRVSIGHAFGLGDVSLEEAGETAELLAKAGISIASTVPIEYDFSTPPIPFLHQKGVTVSLATDSITDHWDPFGTGDMLYKASLMAERFSWIDEQSLAKALSFITGGKTPLDSNGKRIWPLVGDQADAVFVEASCSAEAVARRVKRQATMFKGKIVAGSLS